MSEPFLGEIMIVGFNFAPRGWAMCDGQILPINQNQSLYSLLGTTYGGDGRTTFALPDLRSRTPIHEGDGFSLGEKSGVETVTLTVAEMAAHTHQAKGTTADGLRGQGSNVRSFATVGTENDPLYRTPDSNIVQTASGTSTNAGGGQAHNNMQPYLTLTFVIALQGLFPSRN